MSNSRGFGIIRGAGTIILLLTPIAVMFWVWEDSLEATFAVVSGKLLQTRWDRIHTGFVMDTPTIGKWYFWATAFSILWILFAFGAHRLSEKGHRVMRVLYASLTLLTVFILLCVLTVPFYWTLQYIHAMGFTPRRWIALGYGMFGYLGMLILSSLLIRHTYKGRKNNRTKPSTATL
jgi:hypothetical protein